MNAWPFAHPWVLIPAAAAAALTLLATLWVLWRPGASLRVMGQKPGRLGLGLALVLLGLGLGLAEPRAGTPEVPRLTVHIALDASRSMAVADEHGRSRWNQALARLDSLWAEPIPGVRYSLDVLTGDAIPVLPPGEDRLLLKEALSVITPGDLGSPGTSFGRGLPQVAAQVEPRTPAILLVLSDGEETWQRPEAALNQAATFLKTHHIPAFTVALGGPDPQPVPGATGAEPGITRANPDFLRELANQTGGTALDGSADLAPLIRSLALGQKPLPTGRGIQPAHPEWGAWLALLGLALWWLGAGRPMPKWRLALGFLVGSMTLSAQSPLRWPASVEAWVAQTALERGDLITARRWRPHSDRPLHRLVAAQIDLQSKAPERALETLAPMVGQGVPRPLPVWRAPALLLAARAQMALGRPDEAMTLLERLLVEVPGQADAVHNLQSLIRDTPPPPPKPKTPPPPPPPRPSQGARQDEREGLKQRLPAKQPTPKGIKDL